MERRIPQLRLRSGAEAQNAWKIASDHIFKCRASSKHPILGVQTGINTDHTQHADQPLRPLALGNTVAFGIDRPRGARRRLPRRPGPRAQQQPRQSLQRQHPQHWRCTAQQKRAWTMMTTSLTLHDMRRRQSTNCEAKHGVCCLRALTPQHQMFCTMSTLSSVIACCCFVSAGPPELLV